MEAEDFRASRSRFLPDLAMDRGLHGARSPERTTNSTEVEPLPHDGRQFGRKLLMAAYQVFAMVAYP